MHANRLRLTLCLVSLIVCLAGCGPQEDTATRKAREGVLVINNSAEPSSLDPQQITGLLEARIVSGLFEGLMIYNPVTLEPMPGVAESWSSSADGKVWTFKLRPTARWSNGDPVLSSDFLFSYERMLTPSFGAEYASMLHGVRGAKDFNTGKIKDFSQVGFKAPDPHTFVIELENPIPYFLQLICHSSWLPVHPSTILKFGKMDTMNTPWTRPGSLVGNGAFQLKAWEVARQIVIKKNPYYWNEKQVALQGVEFRTITDMFAEERAFRGGELHLTGSVPPYKIVQLKEQNSPYLRLDTFLSVSFIRINTAVEKNEPVRKALSDARVRQALGMVIDRQKIAERVLRAGEIPAYHLTPPGTGGFTARSQWSQDAKEARRLLAEAGYPDGRGFPKLEYLFNTSESSQLAAQAYQEMWRQQLGIQVELRNLDWKVYLSALHKGDYQLARSAWTGDYNDPNTFLEMFITGNELNQTNWSDAEYDRLIVAAAKETRPFERQEIFQQAEIRLREGAPIIPIVFNKNKFLIRPEVQGWYPNLLDEHPLRAVRLIPSP
jgi:oligopeptide transport system substrate-binding protein